MIKDVTWRDGTASLRIEPEFRFRQITSIRQPLIVGRIALFGVLASQGEAETIKTGSRLTFRGKLRFLRRVPPNKPLKPDAQYLWGIGHAQLSPKVVGIYVSSDYELLIGRNVLVPAYDGGG